MMPFSLFTDFALGHSPRKDHSGGNRPAFPASFFDIPGPAAPIAPSWPMALLAPGRPSPASEPCSRSEPPASHKASELPAIAVEMTRTSLSVSTRALSHVLDAAHRGWARLAHMLEMERLMRTLLGWATPPAALTRNAFCVPYAGDHFGWWRLPAPPVSLADGWKAAFGAWMAPFTTPASRYHAVPAPPFSGWPFLSAPAPQPGAYAVWPVAMIILMPVTAAPASWANPWTAWLALA